jgi:hypothetical protein
MIPSVIAQVCPSRNSIRRQSLVDQARCQLYDLYMNTSPPVTSGSLRLHSLTSGVEMKMRQQCYIVLHDSGLATSHFTSLLSLASPVEFLSPQLVPLSSILIISNHVCIFTKWFIFMMFSGYSFMCNSIRCPYKVMGRKWTFGDIGRRIGL